MLHVIWSLSIRGSCFGECCLASMADGDSAANECHVISEIPTLRFSLSVENSR